MLGRLYKEAISWQGRTERKGLAELLADERQLSFISSKIDRRVWKRRSKIEGARVGAKKRPGRGGVAWRLSQNESGSGGEKSPNVAD